MNITQLFSDEEKLYKAYLKSLAHRSYTKAGIRYAADPLPKLLSLQKQLLDSNYTVSGYTSFYVKEPKEREILACHFKDKIVQHLICDNLLMPKMPELCITDSYAGQKGKGTLFARDRLKAQLEEFAQQYPQGFLYKGDIHKFYYSIDHEKAKQIMRKHFPDEQVSNLIEIFIDSTEGKGLALGNQINTIISNLYLGELDSFVKEKLGIKYYGRYADDFFIFMPTKKELQKTVQDVSLFLQEELLLRLNPKSQIIPLKNGIRFIGFHFYYNNGKVSARLLNSKKRAHKRKFNRMIKKVQNGDLVKKQLEISQQSWEAHACYDKKIDLSVFHKALHSLEEENGK